jgi:O-antigen/teichoic acid export membrane protein
VRVGVFAINIPLRDVFVNLLLGRSVGRNSALVLLMTRYLGAELYETIAWTFAFLATFNSIADLGFGSAHIKRVSEGYDFSGCVSTFAYVKGLLTVAMILVVVLSVGVWSVISEHPFSGSSWTP